MRQVYSDTWSVMDNCLPFFSNVLVTLTSLWDVCLHHIQDLKEKHSTFCIKFISKEKKNSRNVNSELSTGFLQLQDEDSILTTPMALTNLTTQMSWNLVCMPLWAKLEDSPRRFLISALEATKWGFSLYRCTGNRKCPAPR